jgi:hypothetical protein
VADNIAEQALAAERLRTAIDLRAAGAHWSEIASACNYSSPAAALRAVGAAMAAATQRAEETADSMLDTALIRLESVIRQSFAMAEPDARASYDADGNETVDDDRAVRLRALDEVRRATLDVARLQGVDKPKPRDDASDQGGIRIIGVAVSDIV